ncbi:MAG TPA: PQQ-binding-like beta-propeller repeat protein [Solirubrobacterales bacterium]|nr:PQQ-binding-like beta-propeller repeat protein [Solirubrobacterales bacterium]
MRRVALSIAAIANVACLLTSVPASAGPVERTQGFQGSATHEGHVASGPGVPLVRAWNRTFGGELSYPVFDEERVFVVQQAGEGRLYALDRLTGEVLWMRQTGTAAGLPVHDNGRVFVSGPDQVFAYDADTGATLWAHQTPATQGGVTAPVVKDGIVYITSGYGGTRFHALDAATGELRFSTVNYHAAGGVPGIDEDRAYFTFRCSTPPVVWAVDRLSGEYDWFSNSCPFTLHGGDGAAVHDGIVHAGSREGWGAYDAASGEDLRAYVADEFPAFAGSRMFAVADGTLRAEEPLTGTPFWSGRGVDLTTAPLVVGSHVFVGSRSGLISAFDPVTGTPMWSASVADETRPASEIDSLAADSESVIAVDGGRITAFRESGEDLRPGPPVLPGAAQQVAELPPPESDAEAVAYRLNPAHTGFLNAAEPRPPLAVRWSLDLGRAAGWPLIAGQSVFVVRYEDGSSPADLRAIDSVTGATRWVSPLPRDTLYTGMAYENGRIFLRVEGEDRDPPLEEIVAFSAQSGARLWSKPFGHAGQFAPVASAGRVYVVENGMVAGFDTATGEQLPAVGVIGSSGEGPTVGGGRVYAAGACRQNGAFSLDLKTTLWTTDSPCHGGGGSTPTFAGGYLFFEDHGSGYKLDASTGELVDGYHVGLPITVAGSILLTEGPDGLVAQDLDTGEILWIHGEAPATAPIVVGRHVYMLRGRDLLVLDLATGTPVWGAPAVAVYPPGAALTAGHGIVTVTDGRRLTAFESAGDFEPPPETTIEDLASDVIGVAQIVIEYGSPSVGAQFQCRLDGEEWRSCASGGTTLSDLWEGEYRFQVRAWTPRGGWDPTPAEITFTVDLSPPETELVTDLASPTSSHAATFELSSPDGARFECRLDGAEWSACEPGGIELSGLAEGEHTFRARAIDALDRPDPSPAAVTWTVDSTSPRVELELTSPMWSNDPRPVIRVTANEPVEGFRCSIDGGQERPCSTGPLPPLGDGIHAISASASDAAGNRAQSETVFVGVDTQAPETSWESPLRKRLRKGARPIARFRSSEPGVFACTLDGAALDPCRSGMRLPALRRGRHSLVVRALDLAGNVDSTPAAWSFRVRARARR